MGRVELEIVRIENSIKELLQRGTKVVGRGSELKRGEVLKTEGKTYFYANRND